MKNAITTSLLLTILVALLVSVASVGVRHGRHPAISVAREGILKVTEALDAYRLDCGGFPTTASGLPSLITNAGVPGWKGPYLKRIPKDAWGNNFRYSLKEGAAEIRSAGPDMVFDTKDDITN